MSEDGEVLDSLSRAIGEFRAEILLWIDEALVRLREREIVEGPATEERLPFNRLPDPLVELDARKSPVDPVRVPADSARMDTAPASNGARVDSLERLDALARMLDRRLKQAQDAIANGSVGGRPAEDSTD